VLDFVSLELELGLELEPEPALPEELGLLALGLLLLEELEPPLA
jgi:hypothetical protein